MSAFASNEDFFRAVTALVARLTDAGHAPAASELGAGFACLNGLTDGWASFLDAIDAVRSRYGKQLGPAERRSLDEIRVAVRRAVNRR